MTSLKREAKVSGFSKMKCLFTSAVAKTIWNFGEIWGELMETFQSRIVRTGTSLVVQWLRICLAMDRMWIPALVGELRSHMLWGNQAHVP